jgi:hypothetical protein
MEASIFFTSFHYSTYFSAVFSLSFHNFLRIFHSLSLFGGKDGKDMKNTEENSEKI